MHCTICSIISMEQNAAKEEHSENAEVAGIAEESCKGTNLY